MIDSAIDNKIWLIMFYWKSNINDKAFIIDSYSSKIKLSFSRSHDANITRQTSTWTEVSSAVYVRKSFRYINEMQITWKQLVALSISQWHGKLNDHNKY